MVNSYVRVPAICLCLMLSPFFSLTSTLNPISSNRSLFLIRADPKDERVKPGFTACIVTCYWADGQPRTPPLAFTTTRSSKRCRIGRTPTGNQRRITSNRRAAIDHLSKAMADFNIFSIPSQILEAPSYKKENNVLQGVNVDRSSILRIL